MTTPRLSICIATYNRAAFISETLDSIIAQATDDVEIVVVDGASPDQTEQVLQKYQEQFPRLRYVRLAAKGGVDRDYCRAVELAEGEYCWLMSDDDLLKPGAIQAVLAATRRNYGLIIVNAEIRTADMSALLHPSSLPYTADQVFSSDAGPQFFAETATYMSFIGCVVIQRQVWERRDKEAYIGTDFIHVGVIFQQPLLSKTLVIAEPFISIRYGNASWTAKSFETWMFKWPKLIWSFTQFSDEIKQQVSPREPWRNPKFLLIYRAKGAFSSKEYQTWLAPGLTSPFARLMAQVIALAPGLLVNLGVLSYFAWRYPHYHTQLADFHASPFYYGRYFRNPSGLTGSPMKH